MSSPSCCDNKSRIKGTTAISPQAVECVVYFLKNCETLVFPLKKYLQIIFWIYFWTKVGETLFSSPGFPKAGGRERSASKRAEAVKKASIAIRYQQSWRRRRTTHLTFPNGVSIFERGRIIRISNIKNRRAERLQWQSAFAITSFESCSGQKKPWFRKDLGVWRRVPDSQMDQKKFGAKAHGCFIRLNCEFANSLQNIFFAELAVPASLFLWCRRILLTYAHDVFSWVFCVFVSPGHISRKGSFAEWERGRRV